MRPEQNALHAALRSQVEYLRDLGVYDLYRRDTATLALPAEAVSALGGANFAAPAVDRRDAPLSGEALQQSPAEIKTATVDLTVTAREALVEPDTEDPDIAARKAPLAPVVFTPGPKIALAVRAQVLKALQAEIGDCTRCPLGSAGRHTIVFGDGDPGAKLLFVGEGPGADEDQQGIPFVGRAGQLLNNMITAMGLGREQVYIANIVKCRPPANRVPEPIEAITCSQFLFRQIDIIRPKVIVALGSTAATYLLGSRSPLSALRGQVHRTRAFEQAKLIVTYHPAYLLRDPRQKKEAWTDLQMAMAELQAAK